MSGSSYNPPPSGGYKSSCATLAFTAVLSSPVEEVLERLSVSDLLEIGTHNDTGPIQAMDSNGRIAGFIMTGLFSRLLECYNEGTDYIAEIIELNGAYCKVKIYHA